MSEKSPRIEIVEANDPVTVPKRVALVRPDLSLAVPRREEEHVTTFPHLIVREVILFQWVSILLALVSLLWDAPLEGLADPLETPNPAKAPWYFLGLQELLHYFPPVVAGVLIPALVVIALVVIPYARANRAPKPLWDLGARRVRTGLLVVTLVLVPLLALFRCWVVLAPTLAFALAMLWCQPRPSRRGLRQWLGRRTMPEWIMTWFVVVAVSLTVLGTFFRGPGWSLIWPWVAR